MANIFDYIKDYGDKNFSEKGFNEVDNLIFSSLAYIDYKNRKTKTNFYFFIATIFLVIASLIREYWIKKDTTFDEGAEDFAL